MFIVSPSSTGRLSFVEVRFKEKPAQEIRAELLNAHFRWSPMHRCWYGPAANLPARFQDGTVTAPAIVVRPVAKEVVKAPEPVVEQKQPVNETPALFVRRTLGGTMERGFSVVHAGSNKAIGSAYTNLSEEEANRLLAIVLPMADWKMPVQELLTVPGLQAKLVNVATMPVATPKVEPKVEVPVVVLPAKPAAPDKGKPEPGKMYALTGGKDAKAISNGNTWAESEVKPDDQAKPNQSLKLDGYGHAAKLRALWS